MSEHTAGPWVARMQRQSERYGGRDLGWIVETERGERIGWSHYGDAETNKDDGQDFPISGANARLIAAAPDLLAACRGLLGARTADEAEKHHEAMAKAVAKATEGDRP